nr:unnamed protein product [Spirometra erinaceieuropaei]
MSDYIESRYAEEVPVKDAAYSWYLPHHPVFHPAKLNKIRVVFDCAAKFYGISLNDQLLSGPDMTNSLIGILSGFRQKKVSIMTDIESIFHQGRVSEKDRDVLRVPWWTNGDLSQPPKEYRMTEHLFEDTSSSSGATFALSRAITDGAESYEKNAPEEVKLNCDFQLHALSDASETAYGAVAYMVVGGKSETTRSRLIFSKVRIDPIRATILPRVELMAAVVAVKIARLIRTEMSVMISTTFHVTDSPVVLEEQRLTYEVIRTVITEIEQILNDRPLARQSDDPDDQYVLTPNNPRSNRPERRTALVARELARYEVDIAALSETRFSEQGQLEEVGAGYTFFWSGRPKAERRDAGVAFAIQNDIVGRLPCLPQGINDRLVSLRLPL